MNIDKFFTTVGVTIFFVPFIVMLGLVLNFVNAYVVSCYWQWFVIPILHWPNFSLAQFVVLLTSFYVAKNGCTGKSKSKATKEDAIGMLFGPPIVLAWGWILKSFFM